MAESGVFRYLPFKNEYKNRQQDILLPIMSQTNYMYVLMLSVFSTLIQTRFVSLAPRRYMAHASPDIIRRAHDGISAACANHQHFLALKKVAEYGGSSALVGIYWDDGFAGSQSATHP